MAGSTSLRQPQQIIGRHLIELGKLDQMENLGAFVVLPCVDCPAGHTHSSGKVGLGIAVRQAAITQEITEVSAGAKAQRQKHRKEA